MFFISEPHLIKFLRFFSKRYVTGVLIDGHPKKQYNEYRMIKEVTIE